MEIQFRDGLPYNVDHVLIKKMVKQGRFPAIGTVDRTACESWGIGSYESELIVLESATGMLNVDRHNLFKKDKPEIVGFGAWHCHSRDACVS